MNKEEALKFLRNKNNLVIIGIMILGIIFMTSFSETDSVKKTDDKADFQEERLESILSDIDGAGSVSVMITYENTGEKNIAYEKRQNDTSYDEKAVLTDGEPLIASESYPRVKGVIVTADGADIAGVRENLINAVSAAMGVEKHKICIYKKRR